MSRTTITSKGQVTIPAGIRAALGLRAGDRLVLDLTDKGFTATVGRVPKVSDVRGIFRHAARLGTTHAQERAAYEEAVARKHKP